MKLSKLHQDPDSDLSSKEDEEDAESEQQDNFNLNQLSAPGSALDRGPDEKLGDVRKISSGLPPFSA